MHRLAIALPTVAVALMVVKPDTAKALVWPEPTPAIVVTIRVPRRKVYVMEAELVELFDIIPEAATGLGLGPKIKLETAVPNA